MKELQHRVRFERLETDRGVEKRSLKVVDSMFKKVWNKWFPPDTYQSLKYGKQTVEKHPQEGGNIVG